jgi:hypothetical protein
MQRRATSDARGAAQVLDRGAQAVVRGAARCASQVLDRGARVVASGAARLIEVRQGRQRRDAAEAGEDRLGRCTAGRLDLSLRYTFDEFESLADSFAAGTPTPKHTPQKRGSKVKAKQKILLHPP